ncbi:MAG: WYL domain-containing protein [Desulfobacteraceae bacterium]|jgi:predicted DNA-binding transcriptional regulator YafY|nr:WYL domain-containing protein [Desulfobacteraceae bacterium]
MAYVVVFERFVWFDRLVRSNRYPNATNLAERFEISRKTAQRDINFMRDRLGAPLDYDAGCRGYHYTDQSFQLTPFQASQEELLAVLTARNLLAQVSGGYLSREIGRLGNKLTALCDERVNADDRLTTHFSSSWHGHSPVDETLFRTTAQALLQNRLMTITYQSPASGQISQRDVEPHHLQHYMASWVLIARCRRKDQWRKFFLARIRSFSLQTDTFCPRPAREWRSQVEGAFGIFQGEARIPVTLRFTPFRSRWIREQQWHPHQQIQERFDGSLEITFPVADFREVKMMILQFGADCEVLAPEELQQAVIKEIKRMGIVYEGVDGE